VALLGFAVTADRQRVRMFTLPGEANGDGHRGASYWLPDDSRIQPLLKENFTPSSGIVKSEQ
jgi:hypothetical protein